MKDTTPGEVTYEVPPEGTSVDPEGFSDRSSSTSTPPLVTVDTAGTDTSMSYYVPPEGTSVDPELSDDSLDGGEDPDPKPSLGDRDESIDGIRGDAVETSTRDRERDVAMPTDSTGWESVMADVSIDEESNTGVSSRDMTHETVDSGVTDVTMCGRSADVDDVDSLTGGEPGQGDYVDSLTGCNPDQGDGVDSLTGDRDNVDSGEPGQGSDVDSLNGGQSGQGDDVDSVTDGEPGQGDNTDSVTGGQPGQGDDVDSVTGGEPGHGDDGDSLTGGETGQGDDVDNLTGGDPGYGGDVDNLTGDVDSVPSGKPSDEDDVDSMPDETEDTNDIEETVHSEAQLAEEDLGMAEEEWLEDTVEFSRNLAMAITEPDRAFSTSSELRLQQFAATLQDQIAKQSSEETDEEAALERELAEYTQEQERQEGEHLTPRSQRDEKVMSETDSMRYENHGEDYLEENTSELLQNISVCSDIPALPLDDETEDADWHTEQQDVIIVTMPTEDSNFMSSTRRSEVTVEAEQYLAVAANKKGTEDVDEDTSEGAGEAHDMNVRESVSDTQYMYTRDMRSIHSEDKWDKDIGAEDRWGNGVDTEDRWGKDVDTEDRWGKDISTEDRWSKDIGTEDRWGKGIGTDDKWGKAIGTGDKNVMERQSCHDHDTMSMPYVQIDVKDLVGPSDLPVYTVYSPSEISELEMSAKDDTEEIFLQLPQKNKSSSFQSHSYDEGYNDDNTGTLSDHVSNISSVDISGHQGHTVNISMETDDLLRDTDSSGQFIDANTETQELLSGTEFLDHNETEELLDYTPDAWLNNYEDEAEQSVATTTSQYVQHDGQPTDQWSENRPYSSWLYQVG